ncbi:MAG: LamG domain-containing protein, partial [Gammaproteobacteria bacterium]
YQLDGNANDTGGVSGKFGAGAIFNGSSSYIEIPTGVRKDNNFSVSMWFNTNSVSTGQVLTSFRNGKKLQINLNNSNVGNGSIRVNAGNNTPIDTSTSIYNANEWYHLVITQSSTDGTKVYLNNSIVASNAGTTGDLVSVTGKDVIGAYYSTSVSSSMDGRIDDFRVYHDVLTSTEVGYLYNNTTASIPTDNLVAYYKLDGDARDEQQLYDGTASNVTYAYDGTATNVTYQEATNFTPDLVWLKNRDSGTANHRLYNSITYGGPVADGSSTNYLKSNTTDAEASSTNTLTSLNSNGFSVYGTGGETNASGNDYVAWCFNAGDGSSASNTDGSITSTVKANQDAGFSIVEVNYGTDSSETVGHGLSFAPEMIIGKRTSTTSSWSVYHKGIDPTAPEDYHISLNLTDARVNSAGRWNDTAPTDSVFTTGSIYDQNETVIFYCFHSVDGYSKVGSYTATGVAGNMVETGFEPAFVMVKNTSDVGSWIIHDNKRDTENPRTIHLRANTSGAEDSGANEYVSFHSNGFELVGTGQNVNHSDGDTYIYLAIAADPDTTTPTVENSFDVVTYTGAGSTKTIEVDFKPDLIWIKDRSSALNHILADTVRGISTDSSNTTKLILPNATNAQLTGRSEIRNLQDNSFDVTGTASGSNTTDDDFVAWCWKAGDHDDNLPQINTEGSIDSVVSVNAEAGFSIVKYTAGGAANVGHGLSSAPELIIAKTTDVAANWWVYHKDVGTGKYLSLNTTGSTSTDAAVFSSVTSNTFTNNISSTSYTYINYCFHSVTGYQKVGSYSGTGSAGNAQNVGFAPRFVMAKRTDNVSGWIMETNQTTGELFAHTSDAENSLDRFQLNSTGFEFTGSAFNESGSSWIYLAIK